MGAKKHKADPLVKTDARPLGAESSCWLSCKTTQTVNKGILILKHCSLWEYGRIEAAVGVNFWSMGAKMLEIIQLGRQKLIKAIEPLTVNRALYQSAPYKWSWMYKEEDGTALHIIYEYTALSVIR